MSREQENIKKNCFFSSSISINIEEKLIDIREGMLHNDGTGVKLLGQKKYPVFLKGPCVVRLSLCPTYLTTKTI